MNTFSKKSFVTANFTTIIDLRLGILVYNIVKISYYFTHCTKFLMLSTQERRDRWCKPI